MTEKSSESNSAEPTLQDYWQTATRQQKRQFARIALGEKLSEIPRKLRRAIARHDSKFHTGDASRMDFQKTPRKRSKIARLIKEFDDAHES
jgi:hypothetical protein